MVGRGWGRLQLGPTICLGCVELSQHAAFPGRQPGGLVLPGLPFTSLFCPPLGFGAGHKAALQQPSPGSSSGKQQLGKELSCNSCCRAAVPMGWGLILPCSGCFLSPHGTQQIAVFPLLFFFPELCPVLPLRLSLESQLGHPIVLGWPLAGGWRQAALVPLSQAASLGCGRAARLTWCLGNAFSPLPSIF